MEVIDLKLDQIKPYDKNAKTHPEEQVQLIANSIKEFGFRTPIVVDENFVIIQGHGRRLASLSLGLNTVPCVIADNLSKEQVKMLRLADNKVAESEWDEDYLNYELLTLVDDFEIIDFGFELELDSDYDEADTVPEIEENPVIKRGDIIELGNHRLMCGDSTDESNINQLLKNENIDLVLTDPPYRYKKMGEGGVFDKGFKDLKENIKDIVDFNPEAFLSILPTKFNKGINAYIFCNTGFVPDYLNWAVKNKYNFNILTWHKKSFIPASNNHHYPDTEYIIYLSKSAIFNTGLKDVTYGKYFVMDNEKHKDHPTIKPVLLLENEIKISSNKNSIVLDYFGGSGTTMIACENTSRQCRMIELSEKYAQVIIQRWCDYTSIDTIKINGEEVSWSEYKERAENSR